MGRETHSHVRLRKNPSWKRFHEGFLCSNGRAISRDYSSQIMLQLFKPNAKRAHFHFYVPKVYVLAVLEQVPLAVNLSFHGSDFSSNSFGKFIRHTALRCLILYAARNTASTHTWSSPSRRLREAIFKLLRSNACTAPRGVERTHPFPPAPSFPQGLFPSAGS